MKLQNPKSFWSIVLSIIVMLILAHMWGPRWLRAGSNAVLSWDVFGYYLYLPAAFIYNDLGGLGFIPEVFTNYSPAGDFHHAVKQASGEYVMKYPIGQAILYLPFFLIGHLIALLSSYPADGFSRPYQLMIFVGNFTYALAGLLLMRHLLLKYFSDFTVAAALLLLVFGTNYLNYVAFDGAMTHNYLFFYYALLIWLSIRYHSKLEQGLSSKKTALFIGMTVGLMTIVRPIEIMSIFIPLFWGVDGFGAIKKRIVEIFKNWQNLIIASLGLVLLLSIQLGYWKIFSGSFLYYSYEEQGFSFLKPHIKGFLISYKNGWFIYTPIALFMLFGFIPLFKRHKQLFFVLFAYFAIYLYVVSSWDIWWYGGSYSARALVQVYTVLLFPFTAVIAVLFKQITFLKKKYVPKFGTPAKTNFFWKLPLIALMGLFSFVNLFHIWQCHAGGIFRVGEMTNDYYWHTFLKTEIAPTAKIHLDAIPVQRKNLEEANIVFEKTLDFEEQDSINIIDGKKAFLISKEQNISPKIVKVGDFDKKGKYALMKCKVYFTEQEWNQWNMTRLITTFNRNGKHYRWRGVRLQWLFEANKWNEIEYYIPLPSKWKAGDDIQVYVQSFNGKPLWVDDMTLVVLEE